MVEYAYGKARAKERFAYTMPVYIQFQQKATHSYLCEFIYIIKWFGIYSLNCNFAKDNEEL